MRAHSLIATVVVFLCAVAPPAAAQQHAKDSAQLCKDGTLLNVATRGACDSHGGLATRLAATRADQAPPGSVNARCKDGETLVYANKDVCREHGGLAFTFPRPTSTGKKQAKSPKPKGP